jgi:hypothetical protein
MFLQRGTIGIGFSGKLTAVFLFYVGAKLTRIIGGYRIIGTITRAKMKNFRKFRQKVPIAVVGWSIV